MTDTPEITRKTADVHLFPGASPEVLNVTLPGDQVLQEAENRGLTNVVVLGYMPNGDIYCGSSSGDIPKDHFLISRAAMKFLQSEFINSAFGETEDAQSDVEDDGEDGA